MNIIAEVNKRMYPTLPGRMKWIKIVNKNQAVPVMNAALATSVKKSLSFKVTPSKYDR